MLASKCMWDNTAVGCDMQLPFIEDVSLEVLDLGTKPTKVGGVKVYRVGDEEVIMEMQAIWGSNCRVRASAQIKIAGFVIYIPVEVSNIQVTSEGAAFFLAAL